MGQRRSFQNLGILPPESQNGAQGRPQSNYGLAWHEEREPAQKERKKIIRDAKVFTVIIGALISVRREKRKPQKGTKWRK